jgi:hypothetical protein
MSDVRIPGAAGQNPDPYASMNIADVLEQLRALEREIEQQLPRLRAATERLEVVLRATENEPAGELGDDEESETTETTSEATAPDPDRARLPAPALALRSDGKVLLSVAYLRGVDLSERERWEGVVLTRAEATDARERVSGACDDAAAHLAGRLLWKDKGRDDGSGEDSDQ